MSHSYQNSYFPPFPALSIRIGYPGESLSLGPLLALVDTGADVTMAPQDFLDTIGAPFVDDVRIRSHWGEWRNVQLFTVDIGVNGLRLPAIEVIGDNQGDEIILGRNFLNKLNLPLSGPTGQVEVIDR
jgi:predicted aspartyl protease